MLPSGLFGFRLHAGRSIDHQAVRGAVEAMPDSRKAMPGVLAENAGAAP